MTQVQIAACLGISAACLSEHKGMDDKLKKAIEKGTAQGIRLVTAKLMKKVVSDDLGAIIFYLKCKAGWKETQVLEVSDIIENKEDNGENLQGATVNYMAVMQGITGKK